MNGYAVRDAWRIAIVTFIPLLLLILFLYQQTLWYLIGLWNQLEIGNYAHGYLVLLISGYLIYYNRQRLKVLTPCPEYRGVPALIAASMIWMMAALVDIEMLQSAGLLLLLLSIVWTMFGTPVFKLLLFPVLFIAFAIPVWFPLSPLLQDLTADVVFWLIRVVEVPALRIENAIVLPYGKLSIEEACGGLNYFMAALTLGTLYAYLNYSSIAGRLSTVLVAAVAAIMVNIVRVYIVVYLGYSTQMQHPYILDHLTLGWYLFGAMVVVLLFVDSRLHRVQQQGNHASLPCEDTGHGSCNKGKLKIIMFTFLAALIISAAPVSVHLLNNQPQIENKPLQLSLLSNGAVWTRVSIGADDWSPLYQGALDHKAAFQDENNAEIYLYMGLYSAQRQGEELINDLNRISDGKIWRTKYQRANVYYADGAEVLEQIMEKKDGSKRLVWYWYRVAGQNTVSKYHAKALQVLGLLKGEQKAAVIAMATPLEGGLELTRVKLARFTAETSPAIVRAIDGEE